MTQGEIISKFRLKELDDLLNGVEDEISNSITENTVITANNNINYLLRTVGKSILTTREMILLCCNGFPDGALSLSRNLFEQFVITSFIETSNNRTEIINKYFDDYEVQRAKSLLFVAKNIDKSDAKVNEYRQKLNAIKNKYGINSNLTEYWWCSKNSFSEIVECVIHNNLEMDAYIRSMHLLYKRACLSLHASSMGNSVRLGSNVDAIDMGPWDIGQEVPLFLCVSSLIYILGCTYIELKLDCHNVHDKLIELAIYYQNMLNSEGKNNN